MVGVDDDQTGAPILILGFAVYIAVRLGIRDVKRD